MLLPGTRVAGYEILAKLGEGGMGEVYRARDTRLDREVAIKVLPESFASDHDRLMRFEREAKTLASLNHPHIAQIYSVEEGAASVAPGTANAAPPLLVMELVDGETLAERIARGAIPLDEALPIARQIAEALEAAHDAGIVHRDLKPANIKVRPDGTVKVLDFGLAKASGPGAGPRGDALNSPTITSPAMTQAGVILGTAAYMSPEQAKGKPVDKRADIWAFGCVLYEMLAGRRAFAGDDISDTLVSIMRDEPDVDGLPPEVPDSVRAVLKRCLQKDVRRRTKDIGDARLELESPIPTSATPARAVDPRRTSLREIAAWAAVLALAAALIMVAIWLWSRPGTSNPPTHVVRFDITPPAGLTFVANPSSMAVSPDGQKVAYIVQEGSGLASLWVRPLDSATARRIDVTASITNWAVASPSWSPDSRFLLLTAGTSIGGMVRKVPVDGGPTTSLADWGTGAIWGSAGEVLYTGRDRRLYRVTDGGGVSTPLTMLDENAGDTGHFAIQFLPDGRRYLLAVQNRDASRNAVYIASLDEDRRVLLPSKRGRVMYAGGYLWFLENNTLVAQRFDMATGALTGEVLPVVEDVEAFAVSEGGTLVTRARDVSGRSLQWVDAQTGSARMAGPEGIYRGNQRPDLSPDGTRLAFTRRDSAGNTDIWVLDLERNIPTRLTSHPADDDAPVFSPDGRYVAFGSDRNGARDLYRRAADGSGDDELLYQSNVPKFPTGFSADGTQLLFSQSLPETGADVWVLPMRGDRKPQPVLTTASLEGYGALSPDGKWIAYCSGEAGEGDQVYVSPYPPTGSRVRLSTTYGSSPQWSANGREVYYGTPDGTVMRVALTFTGDGVRAGTPTPLIKTPTLFTHLGFVLDRSAARVLAPVSSLSSTQSLTATVNWRAIVERRTGR